MPTLSETTGKEECLAQEVSEWGPMQLNDTCIIMSAWRAGCCRPRNGYGHVDALRRKSARVNVFEPVGGNCNSIVVVAHDPRLKICV
jgi:hypothetical protein